MGGHLIRREAFAWTLFAAALGGGGGIATVAVAQGVPGEAPPREPQFIYDRTCGYCHGHNVGPILLGRKLPAAAIKTFARHGNGAMPAFKPTEITDAELDALAKWISAADVDETEHGK